MNQKICKSCGKKLVEGVTDNNGNWYHRFCYENEFYENVEMPDVNIYPIRFRATIQQTKQKYQYQGDTREYDVYKINIPARGELEWKLKAINPKLEHWIQIWLEDENEENY